MEKELKFDKIGYWSELKIEIIKKYASAYSKILSNKKLSHVYIDAFSGAGIHISKDTGEIVIGSPLEVLSVDPPFKEYHFIDLDSEKIQYLKEQVKGRANIYFYNEDSNKVLLNKIFPNLQYKDYRRGLCLLDPYGLHLNWGVIKAAGELKTIDMFLNFPTLDMNRNVIWRNPEGVRESDIKRMDAFWGDNTWRKISYTTEKDLFGHIEKESNIVIAKAFGKRLKEVAGFNYVSSPLPMKNSNNSIIYYLFFASQQPVAEKIIKDIFSKYNR